MRLPAEAPPTSLFASVVVPSRIALVIVHCNQINGLDRVRVPKMDLPSAISVLSTGRIALPRSLEASPVAPPPPPPPPVTVADFATTLSRRGEFVGCFGCLLLRHLLSLMYEISPRAVRRLPALMS